MPGTATGWLRHTRRCRGGGHAVGREPLDEAKHFVEHKKLHEGNAAIGQNAAKHDQGQSEMLFVAVQARCHKGPSPHMSQGKASSTPAIISTLSGMKNGENTPPQSAWHRGHVGADGHRNQGRSGPTGRARWPATPCTRPRRSGCTPRGHAVQSGAEQRLLGASQFVLGTVGGIGHGSARNRSGFGPETGYRAAPDCTLVRTPLRDLYHWGMAACLTRHFFARVFVFRNPRLPEGRQGIG